RSGCPSEPAMPGDAGRRGNATAATTSTTAATRRTARSGVARCEGAGVTVAGVSIERVGSTDDATGTRAFFARGLARCRFLAVFFTRAPLLGSTSADTSTVQRTPRPARSGRIRFATVTGERNGRAGRFPPGFRDRRPAGYRMVTRPSG